MSKADEAESVDEVMDLIAEMQIDYATRMRAINQKNVVNLHVRRAIDYIYNNLNKSLTVKELAEREKLNPSYFSRLFLSETGKTVGDFITEAKIKTAGSLKSKPGGRNAAFYK
ncbi:MAG: helix-turn-helix transcriptional regulator [Clostridiales bacterium]|nr:helix-turn-helix transcriptional regulator [Clostridiales bacterium]